MPSLSPAEAQSRAAAVTVRSYDIELDLTAGDETFLSTSRIAFGATTGSTFVDVKPHTLTEVTLNGRAVDVTGLEDGRLPLDGLAADNELVVTATMSYTHDGEGLHRSVDAADGKAYTYAMSFLDAARLDRARQRRRHADRPGALGADRDQAAVDVLQHAGRRAVPPDPRRARRNPAGAGLPAVTGRGPVHRHRAVVRRVPPAVRVPLPVRRVSPGVRARVQRRRDGEPGLRDVPRRAGVPLRGHRSRARLHAPSRQRPGQGRAGLARRLRRHLVRQGRRGAQAARLLPR